MSELKKPILTAFLSLLCFFKVQSQVFDTTLYENKKIKYIEKVDSNTKKLVEFYNETGKNLLKDNSSFIYSHFDKKLSSNLTIVVKDNEVKIEYYVINSDTIYKRIPANKQSERQEKAIINYIIKKIKYPKEAFEKEVQGNVRLSFIVDEKGQVTNLKPLTKIGYGLEEEAMKKLAGYKNYGINLYNGKPIKLYVVVPINFQM